MRVYPLSSRRVSTRSARIGCAQVRFDVSYGDAFDFEPYHYDVAEDPQIELPTEPGVHEIFDYLEKQNIPTALASSTREVSVRRMLSEAGLLDHFSAIVCGDMVSHSKPHPEIFDRRRSAV